MARIDSSMRMILGEYFVNRPRLTYTLDLVFLVILLIRLNLPSTSVPGKVTIAMIGIPLFGLTILLGPTIVLLFTRSFQYLREFPVAHVVTVLLAVYSIFFTEPMRSVRAFVVQSQVWFTVFLAIYACIAGIGIYERISGNRSVSRLLHPENRQGNRDNALALLLLIAYLMTILGLLFFVVVDVVGFIHLLNSWLTSHL